MKSTTPLYVIVALLGLSRPARADILELKNGTVLNGRYVGGTANTVRFENSAGIQILDTAQVLALTFTAPPVPAPPPAVVLQPQTVVLPAGTMLLVRMMDSISSRNSAGTRFTTRLEYDLGPTIKGGTTIYGRVQSSSQARRAFGRSTLDLRLTEMVINGQPMPLVSSGFQQAGQASIAKAAKGAAAGAAIGAIAGDAGKGAAIGAVAGALVRGQTITVTPGTLLEFTLAQPVTLTL